MNAGMALKDTRKQASGGTKQVMVLNDHPMACASLLSDGAGSSMEFMIARSLRQDDGRGLAQGVHDSSRGNCFVACCSFLLLLLLFFVVPFVLPNEENFNVSNAWKRANADITETLQSFRG